MVVTVCVRPNKSRVAVTTTQLDCFRLSCGNLVLVQEDITEVFEALVFHEKLYQVRQDM